MSGALYNLAAMTVSSSGTGTITLNAAAVINAVRYLTFTAAGVPNGAVVFYTILDVNQSECGWGVYNSSAGTLTRNPVTSTNSNAAINMTSAAVVIISAPTSQYVEALFADRTYYVATTGSDSSTGLPNANRATATFTNGSANIGWTAHGLSVGNVVYFTNSGGGLPTNFTSGQPYYVVSVVDANTITVSATGGGGAITAGSAGSGTQTGQQVLPFLTIQKGIDVAVSVNGLTFNMTIQVADGTYTASNSLKSYVGAGTWLLKGNSTTPANCVVSTTSANCFLGVNVLGAWWIDGFKVQTTTGGSCVFAIGAPTNFSLFNFEFGACALSHVRVWQQAIVGYSGSGYTISGATVNHWDLEDGGMINFQFITITTNAVAITTFLKMTNCAMARLASNTYAGAGPTAGTKKYDMFLNSVANTGGGVLPGSVAGTAVTGAQYA